MNKHKPLTPAEKEALKEASHFFAPFLWGVGIAIVLIIMGMLDKEPIPEPIPDVPYVEIPFRDTLPHRKPEKPKKRSTSEQLEDISEGINSLNSKY